MTEKKEHREETTIMEMVSGLLAKVGREGACFLGEWHGSGKKEKWDRISQSTEFFLIF